MWSMWGRKPLVIGIDSPQIRSCCLLTGPARNKRWTEVENVRFDKGSAAFSAKALPAELEVPLVEQCSGVGSAVDGSKICFGLSWQSFGHSIRAVTWRRFEGKERLYMRVYDGLGTANELMLTEATEVLQANDWLQNLIVFPALHLAPCRFLRHFVWVTWKFHITEC